MDRYQQTMRVLGALTFISIAVSAYGFVVSGNSGGRRPTLALAANPLDTFFSVLKERKVGLVKSLAGDYDAVAIQSKLDGLVDSNPVLMLSFTT